MTETRRRRGDLLRGSRAAIPVALGYAGIGFAAGVVGARAGLSPAEVVLLSLILFAGSAQFVFADLYTGSPVTLVTTIFLVNLRHLLYATAFAPRVRGLGALQRFGIGAQLTDETFSLASSLLPGPLQSGTWMIALNMTAYLSWATGNLAGAVAGGAVAAVDGPGLDFALAAMFAALLMMQVTGAPGGRRTVAVVVAMIAATVMVALQAWRAGPLNLLAATAVAATAGVLLSPSAPEAMEAGA